MKKISNIYDNICMLSNAFPNRVH